MNILGFEIDIFSMVPALFATILSIYNWYQLRKPADIRANEIISYGLISSDFHEGYQLCIPLILHNSGSNLGLVTGIRIGFESEEGFDEIEILGKANLKEVDVNQLYNFDWDSFEEDGYSMILPTYPIPVEGQSSRDIVLIAQVEKAKNILPVDQEAICSIVINYNDEQHNTTRFPFFISRAKAEVDNSLHWYKAIEHAE